MSDVSTFNQHLWDVTNYMGWLFWAPFIAYGICGLVLMYKLAPAITTLGRVIRVLLTIAFVSMVFFPQFNGLGSYVFHIITLAMVLTIYQLYLGCKAAGLIKPPEATTTLGRAVEIMVDRSAKR